VDLLILVDTQHLFFLAALVQLLPSSAITALGAFDQLNTDARAPMDIPDGVR
jgi:hypothetical protein